MYNNIVDVVNHTTEQMEKENYIANMLVRTLYSNEVNISECDRILKLFKEKVLGTDVI